MYRFTALLVMLGLLSGQLLDRHCPADSEPSPSEQHTNPMAHHGHAEDEMPSPDSDHHQDSPCELAMGCAMVATVPQSLIRSADLPTNAAIASFRLTSYSPPSLAAEPPPPRFLG